jgi:hypothetical protein
MVTGGLLPTRSRLPSVWNFGAKHAAPAAPSSPAVVRRRFAIAGAKPPGALAEASLEDI